MEIKVDFQKTATSQFHVRKAHVICFSTQKQRGNNKCEQQDRRINNVDKELLVVSFRFGHKISLTCTLAPHLPFGSATIGTVLFDVWVCSPEIGRSDIGCAIDHLHCRSHSRVTTEGVGAILVAGNVEKFDESKSIVCFPVQLVEEKICFVSTTSSSASSKPSPSSSLATLPAS